ncbi:hypothetical protein ES703_102209 [subsurface metagenome]
MKRRYDETNGEVVFEDISMAAALMGNYFDEEGKKRKGLKFLRVQDTPFPDTKAVVLKKEKIFESLIQLYFNKKIRIEPHEYLSRIGELKDLIKSRIKQTSTHQIHNEITRKEEYDE